MNQEIMLYQIITGRIACQIFGNTVYIQTPSIEQRLIGEEIYADVLYESELEGVLTDDELCKALIRNRLWSVGEQKELEGAPAKIDSLKEDMYKAYSAFQGLTVQRFRKQLNNAREYVGQLFQRRHSYDMYTSLGIASLAKTHYFLLENTVDRNGQKVIDIDDMYMRVLIEQYTNNRPSELDIRKISKYNAWRSMWHSAKGSIGVFGVPAVSLSDEQRSLVSWSRLYDNIGEAADPPNQEVVDDDDLLDGWLIIQHKNKKAGGDAGNSDIANKHPGAQEVYIPVETQEDARRLETFNNPMSRLIKQQRSALIQKHGGILEQDMPDARQAMMMQATQQMVHGAKGA